MDEKRRVALAGDGDGFQAGVSGRHRGDSLARQKVRILAADDEDGGLRERRELIPEGRHRLIELDAVESARQRRIVVSGRAAIVIAKGEARIGLPVCVAKTGELRAMQAAKNALGVGPVVGSGHAADISLDAGEPEGLDRRANVVEDERGHGRRPRQRHEHADDAAARGADHGCTRNRERGHAVEDIAHFGERVVVDARAVPR